MWAGDWRRPHHYTTPEGEVDAVRNRVGLIDVSTLGKFRIKGPQSVELLERLYPCRFSDLAVGRVRYGAMLNDEGRDPRRRRGRPARGRRVLRDGDDGQHGGAGAMDHLVERRLAARCTGAERDRRLRRRQPGRTASEERHGGAHRRRRVGGGDAVHVGDEDGGRGRAVAGAADRLRGRDGLRDPLPVGLRRAHVGRDHGGGRDRMGSPRSVSRPSGSSVSRSSTSSWARTPTPSRIRSRSGSAGW